MTHYSNNRHLPKFDSYMYSLYQLYSNNENLRIMTLYSNKGHIPTIIPVHILYKGCIKKGASSKFIQAPLSKNRALSNMSSVIFYKSTHSHVYIVDWNKQVYGADNSLDTSFLMHEFIVFPSFCHDSCKEFVQKREFTFTNLYFAKKILLNPHLAHIYTFAELHYFVTISYHLH